MLLYNGLWVSFLKADSHELCLMSTAMAEGCVQKNWKISYLKADSH